MTKNRLVVAEDHLIMREGLCFMLEATGLYEVVGQAANGLEAIKVANKEVPDLILLDISMPKLNGISVIHELKGKCPGIKFIVLTVHDSEEYLRETFAAGANGYCVKKGGFSELLTAIDNVLQGNFYVSPHITQSLLENVMAGSIGKKSTSPTGNLLTQREKEILKLIGEGFKNKQIAEILFISVKTVEKHRSNLMAKLDLHNAASLATYAVRSGLVFEPV